MKMTTRLLIFIALMVAVGTPAIGATPGQRQMRPTFLIKYADTSLRTEQSMQNLIGIAGHFEKLTDQWYRVETSTTKSSVKFLSQLRKDPDIEYIQPNYKIHLLQTAAEAKDSLRRAAFMRFAKNNPHLLSVEKMPADNPEIPSAPAVRSGADPQFGKQWGMLDIGVQEAWTVTKGHPDMIVAVIDTGVDYTHEDLLPNLWRNLKEIPNNGIDDDNNGYIDDVIGWDFVSNDNKPFDLALEPLQLLQGGNPGHGTHCAGNVGARSDNEVGIAGVAPNVSLMALRFISEKGEGTTAEAIRAIRYAVDNGAKVLSNSWGSEGDDPADNSGNKALKEAILYAQDHGVIFVAAAGNGHNGVGYNNDTDPNPGVPASYDMDNIISVAALDNLDHLGSFSNWGVKTVDIGAPGVKVFSTTVGGKYSDTVIDMYGFKATWDGTSMAAPHVAGAAALYWSAYPEKTFREVKDAILASAKPIEALANKSVSGGKLDVKTLMTRSADH